MTELFFIRSAASNGVSYGLNVSEASTTPGTPIITWPWQGGADNELWSIPGDGSIVSALGSDLYLAPDPNGAGLIISTTPTYWTFTGNGTIAADDGSVLTAASGQSLEGAAVQLATAQSGSAQQSWWAAPNMQAIPPQFSAWRYITSTLSDADQTTFVLNVEAANRAPGASVIVWQLEANAANSIWQLTPDGRALSAMDRSLLLGVSDTGGGPVVLQSAVSPQSGQTWSVDSSGLISNLDTGLALGIDGRPESLSPGAGPKAVLASPGAGTAPPSFLWQLTPSSPINTIVAQAPLPFPTFTGSQADVYTYLMAQLGIADIRAEYTNLDATLDSWQTDIDNFTCPHGLDHEAWTKVVDQLNAEITAVLGVQGFFNQYGSYVNDLGQQWNDTLQTLGQLVNFESGDKTSVGGLILSVFEGLLYTVLEAVPGGQGAVSATAVLGNLMEGAINVALNATNVETTISASPFQIALEDLAGQLGSALAATTDGAGAMATIVLSDWGKVQAFYAATKQTGPNALNWPSNLTSTLVDNSMPGYQISVLQMLLPAKYRIYQYPDNNGATIDDVPTTAQWIAQSGTNQWTKYWIADQDDWGSYPDDELLDTYVWGNGISRSDFFQSSNGWGFMTSLVDEGSEPFNGLSEFCTVTICNQTPNALTLEIAVAGETEDKGPIWPSDMNLPPYGTAVHWFQYIHGLEATISIQDLSGNTCASFVLHMHGSFVEAGDVWIDILSKNGYCLSTPICAPGAMGEIFTGAAQITISPGGS